MPRKSNLDVLVRTDACLERAYHNQLRLTPLASAWAGLHRSCDGALRADLTDRGVVLSTPDISARPRIFVCLGQITPPRAHC